MVELFEKIKLWFFRFYIDIFIEFGISLFMIWYGVCHSNILMTIIGMIILIFSGGINITLGIIDTKIDDMINNRKDEEK